MSATTPVTTQTTAPANTKISFIGAGNMAHAMIGGLLSAGESAAEIMAADPNPAARDRLQAMGIATTADNAAAATRADILVIAVKPQVLAEILAPLANHLPEAALVISIAAGIPIDAIERALTRTQAVVRCMPNTPALLREGMTGMFGNNLVTAAHRAGAERIAGAIGQYAWLDSEADIDAVTAVSGSGPAYFFYLMEAMIEAGEALGLTPELARKLTVATARGAAAMANQDATQPSELRHNVTSPGGTTEQALMMFNERSVQEHIRAGVAAAAVRSQELAQEFGNATN